MTDLTHKFVIHPTITSTDYEILVAFAGLQEVKNLVSAVENLSLGEMMGLFILK